MEKNKLKWNEWDEQTFKKANSAKKLIILDITASWCHWCHVMDNTTYEDDEVIKYIEENYIPVRVDRDKRPDIDSIYNLGGWPSTVVLSPEGEVLTGGTYMPPKEFLHMLKETKDFYKEYIRDHKNISANGGKATKNSKHIKAISQNLCHEVQSYVIKSALELFDTKFGGFGKKPKFLYPELLSYLVNYYYFTNNYEIKQIVIKTLDTMYSSEVYDSLDGGFFRYATERDFSCPHYEKLLDDNARLMSLYLDAYQVFNLPRYYDAAEGIFKYIRNNLYDGNKGLFYGSQRSDDIYYRAEVKQRAKIKKPAIDKTYYTDKNSLAINAILKMYCIAGNDDYLLLAIKALNSILTEFADKNGLMKHYPESNSSSLLEDQVNLLNLLIRIYSITSEKEYLDKSISLVDKVIEKFYDSKDTGFFDFLPISEVKCYQPLKSLNPNCEMANILMKLFLLTGNRIYYQYCQEALLYFSCIYQEYGIFSSDYAEAVKAFLGYVYKFTLIGKSDDDNSKNLFNDLRRLYYPYGIMQFIGVDKNGKVNNDTKEEEFDINKVPQIYICNKDKCLPPIDNIEDLRHVLENLKVREEIK